MISISCIKVFSDFNNESLFVANEGRIKKYFGSFEQQEGGGKK